MECSECGGVTRDFLSSLERLWCAPVPEYVSERAREALLDYIGVAYAGAGSLAERFTTLLATMDRGPFPAMAAGRSLSLGDAVFASGLAAHALDFDDGVNAGIIHLGSPVFSLLLPLARKHGVDGRRLLNSAVIGYEAAWTLAISLQPKHKLSGFHATGTCGMLGAALAGAYLLDFTPEERFRAFSAALCSATGTLKVLDDGSELKPYNVAKASLLALESLRMGKAGFAVPDDAMAGSRGFLQFAVGNSDLELERPLKDGRYAIMRTYTKPYAACRYCHPPIEAAVSLGVELDHSAEAVETVLVKTYELAVSGHDHVDIKGSSSAKMSIPYGVAVGFLEGKAGLAEYSDNAVSRFDVLGLAKKVVVAADSEMSAAFPEKTPAEVIVEFSDGRVASRRVDFPLGEPENPLGKEGVCEKFRDLASFAGMSDAWADDVIDAVFDVENRLPELFELLEEGVR